MPRFRATVPEPGPDHNPKQNEKKSRPASSKAAAYHEDPVAADVTSAATVLLSGLAEDLRFVAPASAGLGI